MKELIHTIEVIITKLNIKFGEEKEMLNEYEIFDHAVKFDYKKAIKETETAKIFAPFSIKKKALNFSGRNLTNKIDLPFNEQSLEFIEFDTFGLL